MELLLGLIAIAAIGISIIGWLWIVVMAFGEGEPLWGIGCLIISPLCLVYGLLNYQELKIPFMLILGGFIARIAVGAIAVSIS
ncbi:hypothetical protein Mal15_22360 [Stieleria maiorica]|uniref:Uncharacterized protein n=1 Tax=Stieleria maiorica TaxID=2795974 RepID=A0A5B9MGF5_9BACT|nr:hypothetical protein [Stieleria maiorica]QEF98187.1 hypothetical protein Mal15_22360 [Stieleria maiorica]